MALTRCFTATHRFLPHAPANPFRRAAPCRAADLTNRGRTVRQAAIRPAHRVRGRLRCGCSRPGQARAAAPRNGTHPGCSRRLLRRRTVYRGGDRHQARLAGRQLPGRTTGRLAGERRLHACPQAMRSLSPWRARRVTQTCGSCGKLAAACGAGGDRQSPVWGCLAGRPRRLPFFGLGDGRGGVDQADVAEGLREVAEQLAGAGVDFLG